MNITEIFLNYFQVIFTLILFSNIQVILLKFLQSNITLNIIWEYSNNISSWYWGILFSNILKIYSFIISRYYFNINIIRNHTEIFVQAFCQIIFILLLLTNIIVIFLKYNKVILLWILSGYIPVIWLYDIEECYKVIFWKYIRLLIVDFILISI